MNNQQQFFSGYFNGQPFGQAQQQFVVNPMSPDEQYNTLLYDVSNNLDHIKELLYYVKNNLILRDEKQQYEYYEKNDRRKRIDQFDAQLVLFVLDNNISIDSDMTDEILLKTYLKSYIPPTPIDSSINNDASINSTTESKPEPNIDSSIN